LIMGGLIGATSSIALLNARASTELRRARARVTGIVQEKAADWKPKKLNVRSS
jgi:hypothetical protein